MRLPDASDLSSSGTFRKRVRKAGSYTIICTIHGGKDQKMRLIVR